MDLQLKDKVIIVTGGAKGIGESIVKALASEGAIPIILSRNENDNNKLLKEIGVGKQVAVELGDPEACVNAVKSAIHFYGRIDGVVNNAGIVAGILRWHMPMLACPLSLCAVPERDACRRFVRLGMTATLSRPQSL